MAYTTEYKRRRRVAASLGINQQIKGSNIEHAAAQESREINAQVAAGTYVHTHLSNKRRMRFAPMPERLHFSPMQNNMLRVVVAALSVHGDEPFTYSDSQGT